MCVIVVCVCVCVCLCVCDGGGCGAGRAGECQDHSLSFGEKEQSGGRRQGFLCVSLVPQRLRKYWPTVDPQIYPLDLV